MIVDKMDFCGELCNFAEGLIQKAREPKWIPVTERLPGGYECVLIYCQQIDKFRVCYYDPNWREFYTMDDTLVGKVTHWMPLPEPPKGE